ncbi:metaxin-1-like [Clavelina lepadiformis]|uniref:Metaxin n=1 Tax=Clavelina lepadiformis TaxID=159417 RepID=A0ABP0EZ80_CLALP
MELKCWGGDWGLPSLDIDCLSALTYAYFAKVPFEIIPSLPRNTITGTLPELKQSDFIYSRAFTIIGIFRREGYNVDYGLSEDQFANTLAYISYIEQKLRPAILYTLWLDSANYTKVTRPAFSKLCGFPYSLWYPSRIRHQIEQNVVICKGSRFLPKLSDIEKILYKEAWTCMNDLEHHLGSTLYFYGNSPTTFDAILYGHLGLLLKAPLSSTVLQNHLHACDKLKSFCLRMESFLPSEMSTSVKSSPLSEKEPFYKNDIVISVGVALAAMVCYALTSGVLTERHSKLAEKLGTVRSDDLSEIDDID